MSLPTDEAAAALEQIQDTALLVHAACRANTSIKWDALWTPSYRAVHRGMTALHDASYQTIVLRSGFGLGILKKA